MFVVVPDRSAKPAAGSTTSARADEADGDDSTAIVKPAPARPRWARLASGTSVAGSAPSSTSAASRPLAAARNMAPVSMPSPVGREAGRERAVHVGAPQRREEAHAGQLRGEHERGVGHEVRRFGGRRATEDHHRAGSLSASRAAWIGRS